MRLRLRVPVHAVQPAQAIEAASSDPDPASPAIV